MAYLENGEIDSMIPKKKNASLSALESNLAQQMRKPELEPLNPIVETSGRPEPKRKKIQLPIYPPAEVHEQLRLLAFQERTSINALVMEALDLLFKARGLKSISDLTTLNQ